MRAYVVESKRFGKSPGAILLTRAGGCGAGDAVAAGGGGGGGGGDGAAVAAAAATAVAADALDDAISMCWKNKTLVCRFVQEVRLLCNCAVENAAL